MDELGPDEQRWLDALRSADEPTGTDRARVRAAVLAGITGAAAGATATKATAVLLTSGVAGVAGKSATVGTLFTGWKLGLALIALALAGGITGATLLRAAGESKVPAVTPTAAQSAPVVDMSLPVTVASPPSATTAEPVAEPARSNAPPRAVARIPRAKPQTDDVDAELVLLTQAQRALERGEPSAALTLLAQHGREHPSGALALERDGLRAIASCDAKRGDGRVLAERFIAAHPTSPLVGRVRTACSTP